MRTILSRLMLTHGNARDGADQELQYLVTRIERACFDYRLAAREFVETAAPGVESSRPFSERVDSSEPGAEKARTEAGTSLPAVAPAPNREAAASHSAATAKIEASTPPAGTTVPKASS